MPEEASHPVSIPSDREGLARDLSTLVLAELGRGETKARAEREALDENPRAASPTSTPWLGCPPEDLLGIALSGGGIRSATFSLGLLQGLYEHGILRCFDYLSTVSGGGYAGSFWTAWRVREAQRYRRGVAAATQADIVRIRSEWENAEAKWLADGTPESKEAARIAKLEVDAAVARAAITDPLLSGPREFPGGGEKCTAAEPSEVRHLREFSNFLAPRLGVFSYDTGRAAVTVLSSMLVSLLAACSVVALVMLGWAFTVWSLTAIARTRTWDLAFPSLALRWVVWGQVATYAVGTLLIRGFPRSIAEWMWHRIPRGVREYLRNRPIRKRLLQVLLSSTATAVAVLAWGVAGPGRNEFSGVLRLPSPIALLLSLTAVLLLLCELAWLRRREASSWAGHAGHAMAVSVAVASVALTWSLLPSSMRTAVYEGRQVLPLVNGASTLDAWGSVFGPAAAWGIVALGFGFIRPLRSRLSRHEGMALFWAGFDRVQSRMLMLAAVWAALAVVWMCGVWVEYNLVSANVVVSSGLLGSLGALLSAAFAKVKHLLSKERNLPFGKKLLPRLLPLVPQLLATGAVVVMIVAIVGVITAGRAGGIYNVSALQFFGVAAAVTLVVLVSMDPQHVGLHAFYRERLVRAYMGASNVAGEGRSPGNRETEVLPGDDLEFRDIHKALKSAPQGFQRPVHLVCCAANDLASADGMANLYRGAVSAVLSPVGCSVGGTWAPWDEYPSRRRPTLGCAVTASAAAFNTMMGSESMRLGPAVTFLAAALNLRLGLWVANPSRPGSVGPGLLAGFPFYREMFGRADVTARQVHLSDGGHFENMAVYELVRRHCRVILASDCGADPECSFNDLGNLVRRVREDFGVDIRIDVSPLKPLAGRARQHMVTGDIHYPDGDTGTLLLFKPALVGDEPADIQQYSARNLAFPHESTGDQFYDEAQWEAYRRLGLHAARTAFQRVVTGLELNPQQIEQALRNDRGTAPTIDIANQVREVFRARVMSVFARARREWLPKPEGFDERLAHFTDHVAELDALLRQQDFAPVLNEVYKELNEIPADKVKAFKVVGRATSDALGRPYPQAGSSGPSSAERLAASLYLIRRSLLLMEETYEREKLEANYSHPLYLGVMNWFARWANAPLFRMWWPLLKTMYPQPFTRFIERQFGLPSVEHPRSGEHLRVVSTVKPDGSGFAMTCWRQCYPERAVPDEVLSYNLLLREGNNEAFTVQAAQVLGELNDSADALFWRAENFFVPPGLWGVGIGTDFLRKLRDGSLAKLPRYAGVKKLVVRFQLSATASAADKKTLADELQMYRAAGFRECGVAENGVLVLEGKETLKLTGEWATADLPINRWAVLDLTIVPAGHPEPEPERPLVLTA